MKAIHLSCLAHHFFRCIKTDYDIEDHGIKKELEKKKNGSKKRDSCYCDFFNSDVEETNDEQERNSCIIA